MPPHRRTGLAIALSVAALTTLAPSVARATEPSPAPAAANEPRTAPASLDGAAPAHPAEARSLPTAPAAKAEAEAEPTADEWYGYQTLIADATSFSLGLLFASTGARSGELAIAALVGMGAASPTIHLVHGRPWAAGGSLLLRAGAVGAGGIAGGNIGSAALPECSGGLGCIGHGAVAIVVGGLVGFGIASAIDAALLAREPSAPRAPASATIRTVTPSLDPRSGAAGVVVGGTF